MNQTKKKLLIIQSYAPYGSSSIQESLDITLAAGTFDQDVSLLIEEDACYQLLKKQTPDNIDSKNTSKMLNALPIYGIESIYVCKDSAAARNITPNSNPAYKFIGAEEIATLYQNAATAIRF